MNPGMVFTHPKTVRTAIYITTYEPDWKDQDNPNLYRVRKPEDLPEPQEYYSSLGIPPEIWQLQGKKGLFSYFSSYLIGSKNSRDFWFMILPSGFPDGKIPDK